MKRSCWVLFLLIGQQLSAASVCISGNTLDTYQALGSTGCTIGELTVRDFVFSVVSSGGGAVAITNTAVQVITHLIPGGGFGVEFESLGFKVTGAQFVNYDIGFTWDPTGDMRTAGDILDPGPVDIVTDLCFGASCGLPSTTLHVFQGGPTQLTDSVSFAPIGVLGVLNHIALSSNGSFSGIENDVFVPEPWSAAGVAAGLLMLGAWRRRRR